MLHWRHKQTLSCKEMLSWLSHIIRTFFSIHDFPASNIPYDASLVHLPVTHLLPFIRARVLWGEAHTSVWSWLPRKVCSPKECSMKSYDALFPASLLKESLTVQSTLFLNSRSSQYSLLSAGIIGKYHHTQRGYCPPTAPRTCSSFFNFQGHRNNALCWLPGGALGLRLTLCPFLLLLDNRLAMELDSTLCSSSSNAT